MSNQLISRSTVFVKGEDGDMIVAPSAIERIRDIEVLKKSLDKEYKKFKEVLIDGMEEYDIKKVDTDDLLITYCEPTERVSIDTKKLYAEYPDAAFACERDSAVKASVRITVR